MQLVNLLFIITITALLPLFSNGQESQSYCDINQLEKEFRKAKALIKKADKALQIADCLRETGDTNYLKWYETIIRLYKEEMVHDGSDRWEIKPSYHVAISYFWLEDSLQAEVWLEKAIELRKESNLERLTYPFKPDRLLKYYSKVLCDKGKYDDALKIIMEYKSVTEDSLEINKLIEYCKEKKE